MRMPLVETMRRWVEQGGERWHTPGHKGRGDFVDGPSLPWAWDLTEVGPLVRNGGTQDMVRASEDRLARQFGVRRSWYSVQGASLAVTAAILAAFPPGSRVAVERHAHRSVLAAIILGGLKPQWIATGTSVEGLALPASEQQWEAAMADVQGVVVTRPTYDGIAISGPALERLIRRAHARGLRVVVDEAHGAHWPGREGYPKSAIYLGADLVAHGVHKTEKALTQTGVLHLTGDRVEPEVVEWWWSLMATSSPSYLLLASLDRWQAERGAEAVTGAWEGFAQAMRALWRELFDRGFRIWQLEAEEQLGIQADPVKLSILGPGPKWARAVDAFGQVEKVEAGVITFMLSPDQSLSRLKSALYQLEPEPRGEAGTVLDAVQLPDVALAPRDAAMMPLVWVPLRQAIDRIAGRALVAYPPGIPWVVPGERVSGELIEEILRSRSLVDRTWEGGRVIEGELWMGVINQ